MKIVLGCSAGLLFVVGLAGHLPPTISLITRCSHRGNAEVKRQE